MLREKFLGRCPSHFKINPFVKAFIISESLIWSAWNFVTPIAAIFVINDVSGGNIQSAAFGYSIYLVTRVIFELISGRLLANSSDKKKFNFIITGLFILTVSFLGFAFTRTLPYLYISYFAMGTGLGIAAPPKNSLFAVHLDQNKEATEWGISDAVVLLSDALAVIVGGFLASKYGFQLVFLIASSVCLMGTIPYFFRFENAAQISKNIK